MSIFSFELFSVLFTIMIIVKFKLNQKFILWLLKRVKIFLPPTDGDNELIKQMKKGKSQIQNQKADALVRTCEVSEYINGIQDDNYTEADVIIFFYLTTLFNLVIIELGKLSELFFTSNTHENDKKDPDGNTINIAASFALITVTYLLYSMFRSNFKMGFRSYDAKLFYLFHLTFFIVSIIVLTYFENLIPIDYENICDIINDRVDRISNKASENGESNNIKLKSTGTLVICNKSILKGFYSIVFSFIISLMYRSSTNLAEFDNVMLNVSEKSKTDKNVKKSFDLKKVSRIIKIKQILNILILFLIIDCLLKNVILENNIFSDITYHLLILLPAIFMEMILGFFCTKYYAELFLESNYYEMISYCENPSIESLIILRTKMPKVNTIFWEILTRIFYMNFMAFLLFILFINRANALSHIYDQNFKFRSNFLDSLVYLWILAIFLAKAIFYNAYTYYLRYHNKNKSTFTV